VVKQSGPTRRLSVPPKPAVRVLDVGKLADEIKKKAGAGSITSAQFAMQMIEGAPQVEFVRK
jgi:hypothetical protein